MMGQMKEIDINRRAFIAKLEDFDKLWHPLCLAFFAAWDQISPLEDEANELFGSDSYLSSAGYDPNINAIRDSIKEFKGMMEQSN